MGFLRSLLKKDWVAELDRAQELIDAGDPVQALEIASRARRRAGPLAPRAAKVAAAAKDGVRSLAITQAEAAETKGDLEDAADWLEAALQHESDAAAQSELKLKIQQFRARLDGLVADGSRPAAEVEAVVLHDVEADGLDLTSHYEMLVDTVAEPLRARYFDRSAEFRRALVDLNEGRWPEALEVLEPLAARSPDDAVLRLETGRVRLFLGDLEGALADFDAAWSELGDESLDAAGSSSVPELWAETALDAGRADEVIDRLRELADIEGDGRIGVCVVYANALAEADRYEEAVEYLTRAIDRVPDYKHFRYLLGWALVEAGRGDEAIVRFEEVVEVGCRTGCGGDQVHLPAFWSLARLYSDRGKELARARELLVIATNTQGGRLGVREYEVLERYFSAVGDRQSAERSAAEVERLSAIGEDATSQAESMLS